MLFKKLIAAWLVLSSSYAAPLTDEPDFDLEVIAHRGSGAGCVNPDLPPENTLLAFAWAWLERDINGVELDVHITQDEEIVVMHDFTTDKLTQHEHNLAIRDTDYAVLKQLDIGAWKDQCPGVQEAGVSHSGVHMPRLADVLAMMPMGKSMIIEIKPGIPSENVAKPLDNVLIKRLAETVQASGKGPDQIRFSSFNIDTLAAIKQALPAFEAYLLIGFEPGDTDWVPKYLQSDGGKYGEGDITVVNFETLPDLIAQYKFAGIHPAHEDPHFTMPHFCQEHAIPYMIWTLNEAESMASFLLDMDVAPAGIITDTPFAITNALQTLRRRQVVLIGAEG